MMDYNNLFCTNQVIYTVVSVLPIFEERGYFLSGAHMHRVQLDYKLFSAASMHNFRHFLVGTRAS